MNAVEAAGTIRKACAAVKGAIIAPAPTMMWPMPRTWPMGEDISFGSCCYALVSVIERIMFVLVDRCAPLKIFFKQQGRVKEHNDGTSLRSVVDR